MQSQYRASYLRDRHLDLFDSDELKLPDDLREALTPGQIHSGIVEQVGQTHLIPGGQTTLKEQPEENNQEIKPGRQSVCSILNANTTAKLRLPLTMFYNYRITHLFPSI